MDGCRCLTMFDDAWLTMVDDGYDTDRNARQWLHYSSVVCCGYPPVLSRWCGYRSVVWCGYSSAVWCGYQRLGMKSPLGNPHLTLTNFEKNQLFVLRPDLVHCWGSLGDWRSQNLILSIFWCINFFTYLGKFNG